MSTTSGWDRVRQLFQRALDRAPGERDAFLHAACAGQEDLRREVASLLSAHDALGSFMGAPAFGPESASAVDAPLSLQPGQSLGRFRVLSALGAGGMGEVYRVRDTRLRRDVALKLLPPGLAADPQRFARFERESRLLASLNHRNIASIYDVEQVGDLHVLVLELVDGPTLAACTAGGALPYDTALSIAAQLAGALHAAHERGIVHRDLKPSNVKISRDGTVKLLDFGLAMKRAALTPPDEASLCTQPGMILGTFAYMSPEQARGHPVDERTDVWAFGCLLFELLAGRRAFDGMTPPDTLAAVLEREPDWSRLPGTVPGELRLLLGRCLEKDPGRRLPAMGDALRTVEACRTPRSAARTHLRSALAVVAAAVLVAVVAAVGGRESGWRAASGAASEQQPPGSSPGRVPAAEPAFGSVAVLPFDHAGTTGSDLALLSDGLSEGLIDGLSELPGVAVIARSSSFRYAGRDPDVRAAGQALGAEALLMGRVTRQGEDLLIRAELVDARLGTQVWSGQYRRAIADLQAVQDEIVHTIAGRLRLRLTTGGPRRTGGVMTDSPHAYLLYLTASYHLRRGTREDIYRAIHLAEQALAIDSAFARAWLLIARASTNLSGQGLLDPFVARPRALEAVRRALTLDDALAEAHVLSAMLAQDDWNWAEAERQFVRAIELNPSLAIAHGQYGRFLSVLGRFDEALSAVHRAHVLDPLSPGWTAREGMILFLARRPTEAVERLQHAVSLEPRHPWLKYALGLSLDASGRHRESITVLEEAIAFEPAFTSARIARGLALAGAGRHDLARAELASLTRGSDYVSTTEVAALHAVLGDKEQALDLLDRALEVRDLQLQYLKVVPYFDSLRSESRFARVVRRVGLPD
jgi:eukaryotic-like serine/threonine-protein kinase